MKYYTSTTEFNCGIDLHARQMYVCVMDRQGKKLVHTNVKDNDFKFFLKLIEPYKHDLTVCCECMFGWYWLADACNEAGLTFVLAHALYVKAIHGGKNKNDRIDSEKLTHLLRSNLIPPAYVYPADKRPLVRRVNVSRWNEIGAEQMRKLLGIDTVVLVLAAVDGFDVKSVGQHEGQAGFVAGIGQPIPAEHAFAADGQIVFVWLDEL